jgi:hypothetical protein
MNFVSSNESTLSILSGEMLRSIGTLITGGGILIGDGMFTTGHLRLLCTVLLHREHLFLRAIVIMILLLLVIPIKSNTKYFSIFTPLKIFSSECNNRIHPHK